MLLKLALWFAANPYNITANDIGVPTSTPTVGAGLANVVKILMSIIGMLAIVFILVGGLQMSMSAGNPKRFAQGRETLVYAIVGLAVAVGAYAIVTFLTGIPHRK